VLQGDRIDPALDTMNTRRYGGEEMGRVTVKKIRRRGDE